MSTAPVAFSVNIRQAMQLTGLSDEALRNAVKAGKVLAFKPGREYLINYDSLLDFIRDHAVRN